MNKLLALSPPESFTEAVYPMKTCIRGIYASAHFLQYGSARIHLKTDEPSIRSYETSPFPWISVMQLYDRGHCGSIKEKTCTHPIISRSHLWADKALHSAGKCFPGNMIRYKPMSPAAARLFYLRSYVMPLSRQLWRRGALIRCRNKTKEANEI